MMLSVVANLLLDLYSSLPCTSLLAARSTGFASKPQIRWACLCDARPCRTNPSWVNATSPSLARYVGVSSRIVIRDVCVLEGLHGLRLPDDRGGATVLHQKDSDTSGQDASMLSLN